MGSEDSDDEIFYDASDQIVTEAQPTHSFNFRLEGFRLDLVESD
jgi:hypothetical protein